MRQLRRLLLEVVLVSCAVCAAAVIVAGVLTALLSMADARVKAGPNVVSAHHRLKTPGGPLDGAIVSAPAAAGYSFRLLRTTYAGKAAQLRRASDNAVLDIGFVGANFDTASAATFCASTSCFLANWYDQSGNARDVVQATAANQPALLLNCNGSLPCARVTTATMALRTAANFTPAGAILTFNGVSRRSAGSGNCGLVQIGSNTLYTNLIPNWVLIGATGNINNTGIADTWFSGTGVINGASSFLNTNGTETPGTVTVSAGANQISIITSPGAGTCDETEAVIWDNYALTATERATLTANQRAYWGF